MRLKFGKNREHRHCPAIIYFKNPKHSTRLSGEEGERLEDKLQKS